MSRPAPGTPCIGDQALKACAAAWRPELRAATCLCASAGGEFAALLPGCDEHSADLLARRLRSVTPHTPGASVGVAVSDGYGRPAALMARVEDALYTNKRADLARAWPAAPL